jgi:tRNA 2-thiocytidine biosynthesis protein TtcA
MTLLYKTLRKRMDKAIELYRMIEENDRILIGVSGGPDSLSLLKLIHDRFLFIDNSFSLVVVHVDLGFRQSEPSNRKVLQAYFEKLNVEHRIVQTRIQRLALSRTARKNPCFICSHYRRKEIYEIAHAAGCNKIAYGHHKDDIIETLLMNILYSRRIEAMSPVQKIFKGSMHIIRPLILIEESLLKKFSEESQLPHLPRLCPLDGQTRRQKVKEIIASLHDSEKNTNIRENIFRSLSHVNIPYDLCSNIYHDENFI